MDTDLIILNLLTARSEDPRNAVDDTSRRDERGWTPLHAAVAFNDSGRVEELLADDTDRTLLGTSNNDGWTPLHVAAALTGSDGNLAVLSSLLTRNADRNARNKDGWTPLHIAAALNRNAEVVGRLLNDRDDSSDPTPVFKDGKGRTPLHLAAAQNSNPRVVNRLLKHPRTAPNGRNNAGCTPLHMAAKKTKNPEIVELLLARGADPRLKNEKGQLPVDLAEKNKKLRRTEGYWQLHDAR